MPTKPKPKTTSRWIGDEVKTKTASNWIGNEAKRGSSGGKKTKPKTASTLIKR